MRYQPIYATCPTVPRAPRNPATHILIF